MHLLIKPHTATARSLYEGHAIPHDGDAGFDLYFPEDVVLPGNSTTRVDLQISTAAFSDDTCSNPVAFMIIPRSSIGKTPLRLANSIGLIDAGYRGNLGAFIDNIRSEDYVVKCGERLFQAVSFLGKMITFDLAEELPETERGTRGFGSSGK